jgi:hypothetical protein
MLFCTAGCKISVGSFFGFRMRMQPQVVNAGQLPRKSKAAFAALCRAGLIFLAAQTHCRRPFGPTAGRLVAIHFPLTDASEGFIAVM